MLGALMSPFCTTDCAVVYNEVGDRCVVESLTSSINKRERGNDGLDRRKITEGKGKEGKRLGKKIRKRKCDET